MKVEDLTRENGFLKSKVQNMEARIRELEYDCAELQRREVDLNYRLKELSNQKVIAFRQANYPRRTAARR